MEEDSRVAGTADAACDLPARGRCDELRCRAGAAFTDVRPCGFFDNARLFAAALVSGIR